MALFVGDLPLNVNPEDVRNVFKEYGRINELEVVEGQGHVFIEYEDRRDAEKAMYERHKTEFQDSIIRVEWARRFRRRMPSDQCFKCGRKGHWARDCQDTVPRRSSHSRRDYDVRESRSHRGRDRYRREYTRSRSPYPYYSRSPSYSYDKRRRRRYRRSHSRVRKYRYEPSYSRSPSPYRRGSSRGRRRSYSRDNRRTRRPRSRSVSYHSRSPRSPISPHGRSPNRSEKYREKRSSPNVHMEKRRSESPAPSNHSGDNTESRTSQQEEQETRGQVV